MPKEAEHYQVFTGGKTKRSKPRLLHKNVSGQKRAKELAKNWHESHPDKYVGVFKVKRVSMYRPKKKR